MNDENNIFINLSSYLYKRSKKETIVLCKRGDIRFVGDVEINGRKYQKFTIVKALKSFKGVFEFSYKKPSYIGKNVYLEKE